MKISPGKFLKDVRRSKGMTQQQVSAATGLSQGYVADIENDKAKNPTLDTYLKLAKAIDVPEVKMLEILFYDYLHAPSDQDTDSSLQNIKGFNPIVGGIAKVPVLGRIPAGTPVEAAENILDYIEVPVSEVKNGEYFYLEVKGDSMTGSRIYEGDRVLVRRQSDVENGEIAVVRVNYEAATLKKVKKIGSQIILYPDNPKYEPLIIKEDGAEIIGKVVKVEFNPNKKFYY